MKDLSTSQRAHPIRLIAPVEGNITQPLQTHIWPEMKSLVSTEYQTYTPSAELPERGLPQPVQFRWLAPEAQHNHARFDLHVAPDPAFANATVLTGLESTQVEVPSLQVGTRYYWKVVQQPNGGPALESRVASFETHAAPPRWIHVPGITNVRDLGGWPIDGRQRVRQGMIYRSAELNTHTVLPPEGERVLVDALGIRTDLDLRGTADEESPAPALDPQRVRWAHCPLYAYKDIFTPTGKESIRRAFRVLANPASYPLLMHCWAGADRTGTLAFLVNGALGVSLEDLVHDYELTSLSRAGLRLASSPGFQELLTGLSAYAGEGAAMQARIQAYLLDCGVTVDEIQGMRELLVEESQ